MSPPPRHTACFSANHVSWVKILPKKDEKFDQAIDHLRSTSIPALAQEYADLRVRVVDTQLAIFERMMLTMPKVY